MEFLRKHWLYILAALITIIGLVTGWYFFPVISDSAKFGEFQKKPW